MQTIYPYQTRFAIQALTTLADELEAVDFAAWFALSSAAMCLEHLLRGEEPSDIAEVSARLKDLPGASLHGKTMFAAISVAEAIIEGHRHGMAVIQRETPRPPRRPVWIGIDPASPGADRTARSPA